MRIQNRRIRVALITLISMLLVVTAVSVAVAKSSINNNSNNPYVPGSGSWTDSGFEYEDTYEGLISIDVETDKYTNKDTKDLVEKVNGGDDKKPADYIKELPEVKGKTNPEKFPTTDGYDINLELYDRITDFYDIRYHKDGHNSNVAPGRVKLTVPECEGMKGSDLLVLMINQYTGEMFAIAPIKFDSETGTFTLDLPCVGPYCILHKLPIVVRNVDPDLYPNRELGKIIKDMPYNETMECSDFLEKTLEKENVEELEVDDGVTIKTDDYTSAIALSDVAVHLGRNDQGEDYFSYNLVTRFQANLFRANDKVNWERMLKYERIDYDRDAIMADDKELTKIEPFTLEDSFLYHIDAVTREVSIIYEPTICWDTYNNLTEEKNEKLEKEDILYLDVDDIDGQDIKDRKLVLDEEDHEELDNLSVMDKLCPTAYAADLILDEIEAENNNQPLDEDDVCLVINGDKYLGMGPFLIFMPKKEQKSVFPWWILLVVAAAGGGYAYYRKKNKKEEEAA